ncbi:MAG TPA: hypothetical protein VF141_10780, partial [Chryseolinea sp.]
MKLLLAGALFILVPVRGTCQANLELYFSKLKQLRFEDAREIAGTERDTALRAALIGHADLLLHAGQKESRYFESSAMDSISVGTRSTLSVVKLLNKGYYSLFYDQRKGDAYKNFYQAYQNAIPLNEPALIRACIFAMLRYYGFEIAQNSDFYEPYLDQLERFKEDQYDELWIAIYKTIFLSKA